MKRGFFDIELNRSLIFIILKKRNKLLKIINFEMFFQSSHLQKIVTSVIYTNGSPSLVTLEYRISLNGNNNESGANEERVSEFRLSYYPHKLKVFSDFLDDAFHRKAKHTTYADFKTLDEVKDPGFYIHVLEKST